MADQHRSGSNAQVKHKPAKLLDRLKVAHPSEVASDQVLARQQQFEILSIQQFKPWHENPRLGTNPKYEETKSSILKNGFQGAFDVVKRPADDHYTLKAGQGTRWKICFELVEADLIEDGFPVLVHPYVDEISLRRDHHNENALQGGLPFWDYAIQYSEFRDYFRNELGKPISTNRLADLCDQNGIYASRSTLHYYLYAHDHLKGLGHLVHSLSIKMVRTLQPKLNEISNLYEFGTQYQSNPVDLMHQLLSEVVSIHYYQQSDVTAVHLIETVTEVICRKLDLPPHQFEPAVRFVAGAGSDALSVLSWEDMLEAIHPKSLPAVEKTITSTDEGSATSPSTTEAPSEDTDAPDITTQTEPASNPPSVPQSPLDIVKEQIQQFTHFVHLKELVRFSDSGFGFWLEPWEHNEQTERFDKSRRIFWWWLTSLSGQWCPSVWQQLPNDSVWKEVMLNQESDPEVQAYLEQLKLYKPDFSTSWFIDLVKPVVNLTSVNNPQGAIESFRKLFDIIQTLHSYSLEQPQELLSSIEPNTAQSVGEPS